MSTNSLSCMRKREFLGFQMAKSSFSRVSKGVSQDASERFVVFPSVLM